MATLRTYNIVAICCGIWFLLAGSIWVYFFSLIFAYPFAAIGFYFWFKARKNGSTDNWNRAGLILLSSGLIISLAVLIGLLVTN